MMGLAHRGFELFDHSDHIVHTLRDAGYWSALIGEQHLSRDPAVLGYDHVVDTPTTHVEAVAPATVELLGAAPAQPWFLSVGFFETRVFEPTSVRDALYSLPPDNLPDTPAGDRPDVAAELRERLEAWMRETEDPLLDGPVPAPPGAEINDPDLLSPSEPAGEPALRSP